MRCRWKTSGMTVVWIWLYWNSKERVTEIILYFKPKSIDLEALLRHLSQVRGDVIEETWEVFDSATEGKECKRNCWMVCWLLASKCQWLQITWRHGCFLCMGMLELGFCYFSSTFSKYFLSTGFTVKCKAAATPTKADMVYIVLLYRNGEGSTVPGGIIVISLFIVSVLASIKLCAELKSVPNLDAKAVGSTLARRSVRAFVSAACLKLSSKPGPSTVEREAASRNRPWIAPTYFGPGERQETRLVKSICESCIYFSK